MLQESKRVLISGIGGGGDCVTALHVRWSLEKIAPHVEWIHGGVTRARFQQFDNVEVFDESSVWITENSSNRSPHRLIERIVARKLGEKVFLLSVRHGVNNMIQSLRKLVKEFDIDMMIYIDGGTDSLSFTGSAVFSPVEDTMTLAAIGLGNFPPPLKYRVLGLSVVGSDGEMALDDIGQQLLKVTKAGGYVGGTFFPAERLPEYAELIEEVLAEYPTGTALAPLHATNTPFRNPTGMFNPFINGLQLATFFLDARVAARVGNDFTQLVFDAETREEADALIKERQKSVRKKQ